MMKEQERVVFVDYVRVVAPLLVMLVHASENFYAADASGLAGSVSELACESNRFWVAFWDGGVSRYCVPLFMMISAYLLVPMRAGQTMESFYKRRFKHILPPFIVFLLAYSLLPLLWGAMTWEQSLADLKTIPWNFTSMSGILWFMYPLISLYLIIPVVSPWLERSRPREELIFIGLFAVSTCMPWLHRYVSAELWGECFWNHYHMLWYCSGFIGYLVLAHYIRVHLTWSRRKRAWVGLVSLLVGSVFTGWAFWWKGVPGEVINTPDLEWAWEFCMPNVLVSTFGACSEVDCAGEPDVLWRLSHAHAVPGSNSLVYSKRGPGKSPDPRWVGHPSDSRTDLHLLCADLEAHFAPARQQVDYRLLSLFCPSSM